MKLVGRFQGSVIKYNMENGYGFIKIEKIEHGEGSKKFETITEPFDDAFIHYKDVIAKDKAHCVKLLRGQVVEFNMYRQLKGFAAKELTVIGDKWDSNGEISGNN